MNEKKTNSNLRLHLIDSKGHGLNHQIIDILAKQI